MRLFILLGLLALMMTIAYARENRGEKRYRKFRPFPLKDKRGTDYPSSHTSLGHTSGLFQALSANTGHFARIPNGYVHQGLEQFNPGHSVSFSPLTSSNEGNRFKHKGLFLTLPASSQMLSSKTGPITFGIQSGSEASKSIQSHHQPGSNPFINLASLTYNLPAGSSNYHQGARAVSGGLVFTENHNPSSYHVGLSSGSADSSSYHLPISSSEYPESTGSHQRYQPAVSSGSSYASSGTPVYSLPRTNYGVPISDYSSYASNPSVHYSSGSVTPSNSNTAVSYASPSTSYAVSSDYPSDSQTSTAYGSREQGSYTNISPMYVNEGSKSLNDESFHKYDTISYSSYDGKY